MALTHAPNDQSEILTPRQLLLQEYFNVPRRVQKQHFPP